MMKDNVLSLKWKMEDKIDNMRVGHISPHFHQLCAHRLHDVLFISVTFNKIMAMEEIKLTQTVHTEVLSADVSGTVQTLSCMLKRQKPSFSLLFLV